MWEGNLPILQLGLGNRDVCLGGSLGASPGNAASWVSVLFVISARFLFLFRGLQKEELVLLTHGDSVDKVADGFKVVAQSGNIIAGIYCMLQLKWGLLKERLMASSS